MAAMERPRRSSKNLSLLTLIGAAVAWLACAACSKPAPPHGYEVLVTSETGGTLTIIDGESLKVSATIELGKRPRGVQVSRDGLLAYVALSGSPLAPPGVDESTLPPPDREADGIGVVDLRERRLVRTMRVGVDPEQFALSLDGKRLYVANEDVGLATVVELESGNIVASIPAGGEPEGVTLSPDGTRCYVTSESDGTVTIIDTAALTTVATVAVGPRPRGVVFTRDGRRAFVSLENDRAIAVLDTAQAAVVSRIAVPGEKSRPMGLVLSHDDRTLYATTGRGGQLAVIDVASEQITREVPVGDRPWGIGLSPDGNTVFTANGPADTVTAVATNAGFAIRGQIPIPGRPWGIAIRPAR